ncbi:rRNA methyltransferase 3, mitochondrial isoform X2 [Culex quinquefasciatus]|uniref:rRNA methyltransferase 3, mitochondrial isoform X2 n=1 Tax=Culex quinquefasciatus TaxID=7176 RepID=UPI0018E2C32E|nr:rRNA methyltransferase 3, mitochondrial isoform X2 [Culex quinquefasciatus]
MALGVAALNILHRSSVRNVYTKSHVWQRVSLTLEIPRRGGLAFEDVNKPSEKEKQEAEVDANKIENCNRRQLLSNGLEGIAKSLHQKKRKSNAGSRLEENNRISFEHMTNAAKRFKISKKQKGIQKADGLDLETMNTLKLYSNNEKSSKAFDSKRKLEYLKLKQSDSLYGDLSLLVKSRKRRELKCKMVLEGKRLIKDGIEAGLSTDIIVFNDVTKLDDLKIDKSVNLVQVERNVMQEWSSVTTCPGLIGIFRKPKDMNKIVIQNRSLIPLPITVVCDNIREPNNLGSIIRSSAAIPTGRIVLLKGCTCPWDPKCLRGATGAQFRIPISGPVAMDELEELIPPNATFLVADNKTGRIDGKFSFCRYDAANYREMQHVVLFIGGETLGISNDVRRFITGFTEKSLNDTSVCYNVHIPLANGIESLNTASALSVLLYEIKRQLE